MDEQMKKNLNRMVDRINELCEEARKLRRQARNEHREQNDEAVVTDGLAFANMERVAGILETINALVGCQPVHKMPENIYLHF